MDVNGFYDTITRGIALICEVSEAGGVDLLLLCISGNRIRATALSNYRLFYEALCNKKVPVALVITHLERERLMENWWERNEARILGYGIRSVGHACVTGLSDNGGKSRKSRDAMLHLLSQYDDIRSSRFSLPPEPWLIRLLQWLRTSLLPTTSTAQDRVARILVMRCGLDPETAYWLTGQLAS